MLDPCIRRLGSAQAFRERCKQRALPRSSTTVRAGNLPLGHTRVAQERKDGELPDEDLAAAASSAAYMPDGERLAELRERGVESANWRVP